MMGFSRRQKIEIIDALNKLKQSRKGEKIYLIDIKNLVWNLPDTKISKFLKWMTKNKNGKAA
jgi:hypothetical protein